MPLLGRHNKAFVLIGKSATDINDIQSGDTVIGSLPVNLAAEICQRGAAYIHMTLNVPEHWRGKE